MTKIPKINEQNEVVGETTVAEAQANGWPRRVVRVFVFNSSGQVLIQKRSVKMRQYPGLWDQAVGGHVDLGETELQAAERETQEELGLVGQLKTVAENVRSTIPEDNNISHIYRLDIPASANVTIDPAEVAEVRWVTPTELTEQMNTHPDEYVPIFRDIWETFHDKLEA